MRAMSTRSLNSDINVTPLVDVCLVLLIIFMVVLPSMVNGVDVSLPRTASETSVDEGVLPVTVKAEGSVYIGSLVIRRDEVRSSLQERELENPVPSPRRRFMAVGRGLG